MDDISRFIRSKLDQFQSSVSQTAGQLGGAINQGIRNFNQPIKKTTPINWNNTPVGQGVSQFYSGLTSNLSQDRAPVNQLKLPVVGGLYDAGQTFQAMAPGIQEAPVIGGKVLGTLAKIPKFAANWGAEGNAYGLMGQNAEGLAKTAGAPDLVAKGIGFATPFVAGNPRGSLESLQKGKNFLTSIAKGAMHPEDMRVAVGAIDRVLYGVGNDAVPTVVNAGKNQQKYALTQLSKDEELIRGMAENYGIKLGKKADIKSVAQELYNRINVDSGRPQMNALVGKGDVKPVTNQTINDVPQTVYRGENGTRPFGSLIKQGKTGLPETVGGYTGIPATTSQDYAQSAFAGESGKVMAYVPKPGTKVLSDPQEILNLSGAKSADTFFNVKNGVAPVNARSWYAQAKAAGYDAVDLSKIEGLSTGGKTVENEVRILSPDSYTVTPNQTINDQQAMEKLFKTKGSPLEVTKPSEPARVNTTLDNMNHNTAEMSLKPESNLPKVETTAQAKQQAEAATVLGNGGKGGIEGLEPSVKKNFQDWVNNQRARFTEGTLKSKDFQQLDSEGINGIFKVQAGEKTPFTQKLRQYFDNKRQQVIAETGRDFGYKEEYLPQIWANDPLEVQKVFGTSLNTKAPFTIESLIKDYKTGIEAGLTPRFNTVSQLVSHYESTANKAIADAKFFNFLSGEGLIQPQGKVGAGWTTLNADRFPKLKVNLGKEGNYVGTYKAPDELAKLINNYLDAPKFETLQKIADFASASKNKMLSFGIPRTAINAHGFNILSRNIFASKNPLEGAVTGIKYMLAPSQAGHYLDQNLAKAPQAIKYGLTLSTSEYKSLLDEPKAVEGVMEGAKQLRAKFGERWNQTFEQGLFDKMIPALKLQKFYEVFDGYKKDGMNEYEAGKAAAKFTNDVFGGLNWQELGKSKDWQNVKRALILAPDWLGTNINIAKNLGKGFTTEIRNPAFQAYRRFGATFLGAYATMNAINKISSGHWMYQNEPGHAFEIEAGYTEDGQKRYIRPLQTSADFIRLPVDVAIGLGKGDLSVPTRIVRNRLSTIAGSALGLATDTNYAGQSVGVSGKDKYGRDMTPAQRVAGVSGQLAGVVGFPAFGQQVLNYATGQTGGEQALTQGLELPFRYAGGYFSGSDKQIADSLGVKGKEKYDLGKTLREQAPFSDNQKAFIKDSGQSGLQQLIDTRKEKADLKQQKASGNPLGAPPVEAAETSGNGKFSVLTSSGSVKLIDINKTIPEPKLTGNLTYDKKLISKYTGAITAQQNDIILAADKGKISQEKAIELVNKLEEIKTKASAKTKKPKKLKIIKRKAPAFKKSTPRKVSLKKIAAPKFKVYAPKKRFAYSSLKSQ